MESTGIVGGDRHYTGPGLGDGPWKCPACSADQSGPIALGCQDCGSGTVQPYKAQPQLQPARDPIPPLPAANALHSTPYAAAERWAEMHPDASLAEAFVAGYELACVAQMSAPPITVDVAELAPEGKPRRTIVAALSYFKDQILSRHPEEIETGEWCSLEEVDHLIAQLQEETS